MDERTREWFDGIVAEHIAPLFSDFEVSPEAIGVEGEGLAAVIGFAGGEIRGTLGVIGRVEAITRLMPEEVASGDPTDMVAELANRALGRLKYALCKAGIDVWSTTPVALTGISLGVIPSERVRTFAFQREGVSLHVWVDCAVPESLPPDPDALGPDEEPLAAGESLFF